MKNENEPNEHNRSPISSKIRDCIIDKYFETSSSQGNFNIHYEYNFYWSIFLFFSILVPLVKKLFLFVNRLKEKVISSLIKHLFILNPYSFTIIIIIIIIYFCHPFHFHLFELKRIFSAGTPIFPKFRSSH
jgi:hypothetical protein